jgi:hypothetical protein
MDTLARLEQLRSVIHALNDVGRLDDDAHALLMGHVALVAAASDEEVRDVAVGVWHRP